MSKKKGFKNILKNLMIGLFSVLLTMEVFAYFQKLDTKDLVTPSEISFFKINSKNNVNNKYPKTIECTDIIEELYKGIHHVTFRGRGPIGPNISYPRYIITPHYEDHKDKIDKIFFIILNTKGDIILYEFPDKQYKGKLSKEVLNKLLKNINSTILY